MSSIVRSTQVRFVVIPSAASDQAARIAIEGPSARVMAVVSSALPIARASINYVTAPAYGLLAFMRDCLITVFAAFLMILTIVGVSYAADHVAPAMVAPASYSLMVERDGDVYAVDENMTADDCAFSAAHLSEAEFYPGLWLDVPASAARYCAAQ
jgi:hypothetical protein